MRGLKEKWEWLSRGKSGWLVYILLGAILALTLHLAFGFLFSTQYPVVTISTGSLQHSWAASKNNILRDRDAFMKLFFGSGPYYLCGNTAENPRSVGFNEYWKVCGNWYSQNGISKEEFRKYPHSNGLYIGDIIFIRKRDEYKEGDIVVFQGWKPHPIIHRIVKKERVDGEIRYTTKGDHNPVSDSSLFRKIENEDIYGRAVLRVPFLGWVKILTVVFFVLNPWIGFPLLLLAGLVYYTVRGKL